MATHNIRPIAPVRFNWGYIFKTPRIPAGVEFRAGAPARIEEGFGVIANPVSQRIAGFYIAGSGDYAWKEDTFRTVRRSVPIALANQEFRGTLVGTYQPTDIGAEYGLVQHSSGYWVVNKADTANPAVRVVGVDREVEVGDVNAPVRFVVLDAKRQVIG
jgi:hypothetical protein